MFEGYLPADILIRYFQADITHIFHFSIILCSTSIVAVT